MRPTSAAPELKRIERPPDIRGKLRRTQPAAAAAQLGPPRPTHAPTTATATATAAAAAAILGLAVPGRGGGQPPLAAPSHGPPPQ